MPKGDYPRPGYLPSEEEIAAACASIQATWSDREKVSRRTAIAGDGGKAKRTGKPPELTAPFYTYCELRRVHR